MPKKQEVYEFKKGDGLFYDQILFIASLAGGDWWEKWPPGDLRSDNIIITRDIKITIIVED